MVRVKEVSEIPKQAKEAIALYQSPLQNVPIDTAIEALLNIEKAARLNNDTDTCGDVCEAIVKLCAGEKDSQRLNDNISLLAKRRGQHRNVVSRIVSLGMKLLEESKGGEELALLTTLRAVTEGKIYVEVEWARLTRRLARIREGEGKVDEAAEIMQEVHVETYGAMEKREKTEFLLEQVRLCLDKKDMVRTELIANKITQKVLDEPLLQDVRLAYYQLMVRYHTLKASDIDLARDHYAMYVTPGVGSWEASLRRAVVQTALSPYGKDSTQLMAKLAAEVRLASLPTYRAIVDAYITQEVAGWPALRAAHGAQLAADHPDLFAQPDSPAWKKLHASVVQRNIKVISTYYSRITTDRLAELLDLPEAEAEAHLSKLVIDGLVWAKIDRPGKVVVFRKMQNPDALLNEWGSDITKLLNLVEKTVHVVGMDIQKHKVTI